MVTVIEYYDPDFCLITETWFLPGKERVNVRNHAFFTCDRQDVHRNAPKGSGGVGILIHDRVLNRYKIKEIAYISDGQLGIILENKQNEYQIGIVVGYISPEGSKYGRDADEFYDCLTRFIYAYNNCDHIVLGGDYNARLGQLCDYIPDIDDIPTRTPIDPTKNKHGECLIDFCKDVRYAIVNGRITPEYDNHTSFNVHGSSVVDYVLTQQENIDAFIECKTITMNNVLNEIQAMHPDFHPDRLSDHSLILTTFKESVDLDYGSLSVEDQTSETNKNVAGHPKPTRYRMTGVKSDFLASEEKRQEIIALIDVLINEKMTQAKLDAWYESFIAVYHDEMNKFYRRLDDTPVSRKNYYIAKKEWWSDELNALAKETLVAERAYMKLVKKQVKCLKEKAIFLSKQKLFDKLVKQTKRRWQRNKVFELEKANIDDHQAFWQFIKGLRKSKKSTIPMDTYMDDDVTLTNDPEQVLNRWARDFGSLLTPPEKNAEGKAFVEEIKLANAEMENLMSNTLYNSLIEISC